MGKKFDFNYIIIGGGPAGTTLALTLAKNTKKTVALVERSALGGSNLNTRDVPYLVGLGFSHLYSRLSHFPEFKGQDLHYNFPTIVSHQNFVITSQNNQKELEEANITLINGFANFLNSHTIAVGDKQFTTETFVLATGAVLDTSGIQGADLKGILTPDTALRIRRLPKYVLVVGGGPTGCEIATYYAELGAKVVLMEQADHILPKEDIEVSQCISYYFANKLGILVMKNARIIAIEPDGNSKKVFFTTGGQERTLKISNIVLATGSKAFTDYGLGNTGVKIKRNGDIAVDKFFQTTDKSIYAIGDCIGGSSSTERAEYQASVLASNLLKRAKTFTNYKGFSRVTNTYPEVATVGLNEIKLKKLKRGYKAAVVYFKDIPASKIENLNYGFVKIIIDSKKHIIGATVVAPNASLIIEELAVAIRHQLTILEIASTPHITNSFNYAVKQAARQLIK
jgi:dihydrolipoamide dehydrogenase